MCISECAPLCVCVCVAFANYSKYLCIVKVSNRCQRVVAFAATNATATATVASVDVAVAVAVSVAAVVVR